MTLTFIQTEEEEAILSQYLRELHEEAIQTDEWFYKHICNHCLEKATDEPCTSCQKPICKKHTHLTVAGAGLKVKVCPLCYGRANNWGTPPDEEGPTNASS